MIVMDTKRVRVLFPYSRIIDECSADVRVMQREWSVARGHKRSRVRGPATLRCHCGAQYSAH
eukprot:112220-Prorocentrum_minimum.AAC.5